MVVRCGVTAERVWFVLDATGYPMRFRCAICGIMREAFFTGQQFHHSEHNIVRYFLSCSDEEEDDEEENKNKTCLFFRLNV